MRGSVQALTPRELERLPEADRDKEHVSVWTAEIMLRAGGEDGDKPDAILYRGREYIVVSVEDWHYLGTAFCKATAMKERA